MLNKMEYNFVIVEIELYVGYFKFFNMLFYISFEDVRLWLYIL